jgi:Domain of Unknown Function (DUF1080)
MRRTHLFALGLAVMFASALPLARRQGAQPAAPPAVPQPPQPAQGGRQGVPGGVATDPANPRPNQPNFIGFERPAPPMTVPAGFTPLFNGENLAGWHVSPTNHHGHTPDFHVTHGMIVGTQMPYGGGGILLTDKKFKNFELYMEVKPDYGCDSGLFFRSTEWGAAYQVTMDYLPGGSLGAVICEGGMQGCGRAGGAGAVGGGRAAGGANPPAGAPAQTAGAPAQPAGNRAAGAGAARGAGGPPPVVGGIPLGTTTPVGESAWMKVWKREDWNTVRIRVTGDVPHAIVWINDTQITDYTDTANHAVDGMIDGPIAIQVHGGPQRWVPGGFWRWRVIAIKEL